MGRWKEMAKKLTAILILMTPMAGNAAVTLDVQGGALMGASNVYVNGMLYDVEFIDGACAAHFDGCDATSDFDFQNRADADSASQALLDQVLLDVPEGMFDTLYNLTNGCEVNIGALPRCEIWIPYDLGGLLGVSRAINTGVNDSVQGLGTSTRDLSGDQRATWAVWSQGGNDADGDQVDDSIDLCPNTDIPEGAPSRWLGKNRWSLDGGDDGISFTQREPQAGSVFQFATVNTGGCSCEQIVAAMGAGQGHLRAGCSTSLLLDWIQQVP